jgi:phosphoribosylformimino-5-aminoimidazole carboxamide ribotide isomerase
LQPLCNGYNRIADQQLSDGDPDMRVIGVLDLMSGQVVRGVGGRRHDYRPVLSQLTASSRPLDVACAFREHFGLTELYLADLDALAGAAPAWETYAELRALGFCLWVDAGVRDAAGAQGLARAGVERVVVGLETVAGPAALAEAVRDLAERVVFSLDLRGGVPLGNVSCWGGGAAGEIARQALRLAVRRVLILDLARVGTGTGPGARELCRQLALEHPQVEVSAGGGVRGRADLERLREDGVQVVLVASAFHDGRLARQDLANLETSAVPHRWRGGE